jgi:Uma2 family endonuclease
MRQPALTIRRWTRAEYDRLVGLGMLDREPIELIGGQLLVAEPQGSYHAAGVGRAGDVLRAALPAGWLVRIQMPVALDDESEPEPDLAVVAGTWADYDAGHPSRPALVVEVAESSLVFDRVEKGSLYARAGIADYWIVNLVDRMLEVYREPAPDPGAPYGWRYLSGQRLGAAATVSALALPSVRVAVPRAGERRRGAAARDHYFSKVFT